MGIVKTKFMTKHDDETHLSLQKVVYWQDLF